METLPPQHYDTLQFLLRHLLKITEYREYNRMHISNLAIVFGPTIMWAATDSMNLALDMMQQNLVAEALLINYQQIFTWRTIANTQSTAHTRFPLVCYVSCCRFPLLQSADLHSIACSWNSAVNLRVFPIIIISQSWSVWLLLHVISCLWAGEGGQHLSKTESSTAIA